MLLASLIGNVLLVAILAWVVSKRDYEKDVRVASGRLKSEWFSKRASEYRNRQLQIIICTVVAVYVVYALTAV